MQMLLTRTLSAFFLATFAPVAVAESLLATNVVVVSPERSEAVRGATIRIEDGRISDVVVGNHTLTADRRIDGGGRYLLPGLIDSHVHLGSNAGMRGDHAQANRALLDGYHRREPLNYLAYGFTTLIDVSTTQSATRPGILHRHTVRERVRDGFRTCRRTLPHAIFPV